MLRSGWVAVGGLAALLHLPLGWHVLVALGIPWVSVLVLLTRDGTAERLIGSWRDATSTRAGLLGASSLAVIVAGVACLVSPGAGVLLGLWLVAGGAAVGLLRGPSVLREHLVGWSLLGIVTAVMLLGAEGVLRIESVATRLGTPAEVNRWYYRYDRLWERNALGIRSPHETLRKEEGVLRIVAIGDSYTWGDKIAHSDSTWPAQLEAELGRRTTRPVEVVNLGRNGFTTVNGAEMLRRLGWQFDPDIVVAQFYLNDILPSGPDFQRAYSPWLFPRVSLLPRRYRTGPLARSALLSVVEGALTSLRHGDRTAQNARWTEMYQRRGPEWRELVAALEEMGGAAAERGVSIVLLLFPDFIPGLEVGTEAPFMAIHDQVSRVASGAGYSVLDLTDVYLGAGGDLRQWWATPYDTHPNESAAGLAATALADHLLEDLGLEGSDLWDTAEP